MNGPEEIGTANPPGPPLLPKIILPDGTPMGDSTYLIEHFENALPKVIIIMTCSVRIIFWLRMRMRLLSMRNNNTKQKTSFVIESAGRILSMVVLPFLGIFSRILRMR